MDSVLWKHFLIRSFYLYFFQIKQIKNEKFNLIKKQANKKILTKQLISFSKFIYQLVRSKRPNRFSSSTTSSIVNVAFRFDNPVKFLASERLFINL